MTRESIAERIIEIGILPVVRAASAAEAIAVADALGVGGDLCDLQAIRSGRRETLVAAARAYVSAVEAARAGSSY
jgi:2-keto-3-deoxy-6-phosphogluconate aldolase